ncbi:hypothetical protein T265_06320 [Opisthorchis viverrini]|uniref:ISXO2-like transposase domain-containing protein n=1 Tax=Opisthorchis viverrini TaxID=6198 RepID=A0A074ZGY9_OPIVI|nr:hypothetical protein T265_06320 [Opisthorchis viverrini]KER26468.1 hypothetical protein T265_06320 [Opisthorchis viverrini]
MLWNGMSSGALFGCWSVRRAWQLDCKRFITNRGSSGALFGCWSVHRAWQLDCKRFITNQGYIVSAGLSVTSIGDETFAIQLANSANRPTTKHFQLWRCNARQCRYEIGLRKGTWLDRSRMELRIVILFIYCWSKSLGKIKFCSKKLSTSHTTPVDWKKFLRDVCVWQLLQTPTVIGGPGLHVEIDETLISRRKNHAGRVPFQQSNCGHFDGHNPGLHRSRLNHHLRFVGIIKGAETMIEMNYTHETVNDTVVDPTTGAHTQTIESLWVAGVNFLAGLIWKRADGLKGLR